MWANRLYYGACELVDCIIAIYQLVTISGGTRGTAVPARKLQPHSNHCLYDKECQHQVVPPHSFISVARDHRHADDLWCDFQVAAWVPQHVDQIVRWVSAPHWLCIYALQQVWHKLISPEIIYICGWSLISLSKTPRIPLYRKLVVNYCLPYRQWYSPPSTQVQVV